MPAKARNVAVLGATGSIGCSALDVIRASGGTLRAFGLSAHRRLEQLEQQAAECGPRWVIATDSAAEAAHTWQLPACCEPLSGEAGLLRLATDPEVDVVLTAIVGAAGLESTLAALEAGKTIALANKETMVVAGRIVTDVAGSRGACIVPVDSEHSALFQALMAGRRGELRRVVLTASGGPFRELNRDELARVTVEEALAHPTWNMGPKITIDSATLMNKALEIIEARWLFNLEANQIDVVIHPQSIVHSFVEFIDGSIVAQLGLPDMRLPIQYALTYPHRTEAVAEPLDWRRAFRLDFEPPDFDRFDALRLGLEAARVGGTAGAVLNGANEAAVAGFLAGELDFCEIVPLCRRVLEHHDFEPNPSLARLRELDGWARQEVERWVCT